MSPDPNLDPLSPDAPIVALMSLSTNPLLKDLQPDDPQLRELVSRLRNLATSPQALSSKLESEKPTRARKQSESARRKALLDEL